MGNRELVHVNVFSIRRGVLSKVERTGVVMSLKPHMIPVDLWAAEVNRVFEAKDRQHEEPLIAFAHKNVEFVHPLISRWCCSGLTAALTHRQRREESSAKSPMGATTLRRPAT